MMLGILNGINAIFSLYIIVIIIRCIFSFIPRLDYKKQPYRTIMEITDPYLNLFRKFIPPIGMVDLSPTVAVIVLLIIQNIIQIVLSGINI
ncbi:MAG: YggT family protein [Candidatus Gastranaerophilaceae bacterium]|nr:YggT family protein [Candidatus Gastranaerophilaceae bacterium]